MSAKQVTPERIISAQRELRAEPDELGADELALDRHHVAHQPDVEPQVVGESAQQRHRHVRVRVDEPRHDDAAAAVDRLGRLVGRGVRSDGDDRVAGNRHAARVVHRELLVHRQNAGVGQEDVAARHSWIIEH